MVMAAWSGIAPIKGQWAEKGKECGLNGWMATWCYVSEHCADDNAYPSTALPGKKFIVGCDSAIHEVNCRIALLP